MEKDTKLRAALAKLERVERDPQTRRFFDQVDRINAITDWETRLDPESDEATTERLRNFFSTILFCDRNRLPLPAWARRAVKDPDALVTVITKHSGTPGGRHTNPLVARKELLRARYTAAAVKLASIEGKRGDEKIKAAQDILKKIGFHCGFETVRRAQGRSKTVPNFFVLNLKKLRLRNEKLV